MVASIATVDPDGAPRQAVVWYRLEPDGRILVNSRTPRRWPREPPPRSAASLAVVDQPDPDRWVGMTAAVDEVVDDVERARGTTSSRSPTATSPRAPTRAADADFRSQPRVTFLLRVTAVHDHLEDD